MLDGGSGAAADRGSPICRACPRPRPAGVQRHSRDSRTGVRRQGDGRPVEILLERVSAAARVLAQLRASKAPKHGSVSRCAGRRAAAVRGPRTRAVRARARLEAVSLPRGARPDAAAALHRARADARGSRALPDRVRARARRRGRADGGAAFRCSRCWPMLRARASSRRYLTLHVGAGTFQPVRADDIEEHTHARGVARSVPQAVCDAVARGAGARAAASWPSAPPWCARSRRPARSVQLAPFAAIPACSFIPGIEFRVVDAWSPTSICRSRTLLMLVCGVRGTRADARGLRATRCAQRYRFFSYGDAMFVTPSTHVGTDAMRLRSDLQATTAPRAAAA